MFLQLAGCRTALRMGKGRRESLTQMNKKSDGQNPESSQEEESKKEIQKIWKKKSESVSHPPFKKFCCCRLRTGCLILGWFQVVFFTILIIAYSISYDGTKPKPKVKVSKNGTMVKIDKMWFIQGLATPLKESEPAISDQENESAFDINISIADLVDASLSILAAGFLLIGVYKDKQSFIKVFVIFFCINICFEVIYGLCNYNEVMILIPCLVAIMLGFVNVLVGYSYLSKLRNKEMFGKDVEEETDN